MSLNDFLAAQGRTYRRARELQAHMDLLAEAAASVGSYAEADRLRKVGQRAWVVADQYIETMFDKVA